MAAASGHEFEEFTANLLRTRPEASPAPRVAGKKLADAAGRVRFGKYKGLPLENIPAVDLAGLQSWATQIIDECQQELDRRVAELREVEP